MKLEQYFKKIIENDVIEGGWLFLGIDEEALFQKSFNLAQKISSYQFIYLITNDNSIGEAIKNKYQIFEPSIKSVFEIQKLLSLASEEKKVVIVRLIENLSEEAQNSLLKITEEPPPHIVFFFTSSDENQILPTLLSRLKIIKVPLSEKNLFYQKRIPEKIKEMMISSRPLKIYLEEFLEEEPVIFLENLLVILRDQILNSLGMTETKITDVKGQSSPEALEKTLKALEGIKYYNLNPRLQIENILFQLQSK